MCSCIWVGGCGCVREHLQRDQPWGYQSIAAVEGKKEAGSDLAHNRCSKQPTLLESLASVGSAVHSLVVIYLFWLGGKCMFSGVGYQWQEGSKTDTTNEAVKVARQLHPKANIPCSCLHILLWLQWSLTARGLFPTREKERENECHCVMTTHDGMCYECVEEIRNNGGSH